jgi:hypothetical protein
VQVHFPDWMARGEEDARVKDKAREASVARVGSFILDDGELGGGPYCYDENADRERFGEASGEGFE